MTDSSSIAEAWRVEALRRSAELDQGLVDTVFAEEVLREAQAILEKCKTRHERKTMAAQTVKP